MRDTFRILIGYDGSAFADAALDDMILAGLPKVADALVMSVAEVWLPPHDGEGQPEFISADLKHRFEHNLEEVAHCRELADQAAKRLRTMFPDWTVAAEATYGSPAWEMLFRASDFKPDLILVGAQGVHGIAEILIGSIAQKIVTEAKCSVRVARGDVAVDPEPARILIGYDGTQGANAAVDQVIRRNWPAGTSVRIVIVNDTALIRKSLNIDDARIFETGTGIAQRFRDAGYESSFVVREGNPKKILVTESLEWKADSVFLGATKFVDPLTKYVLGSVASAVASRASCSVEIVRPRGGGR
jgi:nucleotide-binding universal stress UspA family protein